LGLQVVIGGMWRYHPSTYAIHAPASIATSHTPQGFPDIVAAPTLSDAVYAP